MPRMSDLSVMLFPWDKQRPSVAAIIDAARLAEDLGFYSVTLPTHMTLPPGWLFTDFENRDVLDALAIVPAIATATRRIRVGFNSVLLPVLPPYQWAKYLATLDIMSDGRLINGVAMGWWEEDFTSVGVDRRKRGKLFDEQLEVLTRLFTEESVTFAGEHYRLDGIGLSPKPLQKPYPPIWIGGGLKSVERTARYAECVLVFWPSEESARDRWLPELARQGKRFGTDPKLAAFTFAYVADCDRDLAGRTETLRNAVGFEDPSTDPGPITISGSPERCAERLRALAAAGVWHFVLEFQFHGVETVAFGMRQMERFAREVAPLL
jgi:alkanesulfonate monooxygenase SsuD/methylene tetrahydromethanopterin reductase-like flavin-dependent oxidoreductase (luciferase family)